MRGIVVGDFLRRLVARTLAQQFSQTVLGGNISIPIRSLHEGRNRGRDPRVASIDEFGRERNRGVN